jgi:hypothetical protein
MLYIFYGNSTLFKHNKFYFFAEIRRFLNITNFNGFGPEYSLGFLSDWAFTHTYQLGCCEVPASLERLQRAVTRM